jgi:sterol desaturase/sphingolipid hydroxylase (fatty acid hydroxylase superfamily)
MKLFILLAALVMLGLVFGVAEKLWPAVKGQRRLRRGLLTDAAWWLLTPTLGKLFSGLVIALLVVAVAPLAGSSLTIDNLKGIEPYQTWVGRRPLLLQIAAFVLLADFLGYWQHRAFHQVEKLWRIHAVHHSSTEVDWLSSVRVHPLNDALSGAAVAVPLLLFGFKPETVAAYLPFLHLYAILLHANLDWDFGPLRYVLASPAFHRWHHAADREALDKNFAGMLPLWDVVFGTIYLPRNARPERFGIHGDPLSGGILAQMLYPFRRGRLEAAEA